MTAYRGKTEMRTSKSGKSKVPVTRVLRLPDNKYCFVPRKTVTEEPQNEHGAGVPSEV
jgi:hypothetical protein